MFQQIMWTKFIFSWNSQTLSTFQRENWVPTHSGSTSTKDCVLWEKTHPEVFVVCVVFGTWYLYLYLTKKPRCYWELLARGGIDIKGIDNDNDMTITWDGLTCHINNSKRDIRKSDKVAMVVEGNDNRHNKTRITTIFQVRAAQVSCAQGEETPWWDR